MTRLPNPDDYSMTIEWEPEGAVFVVTVPELPGCQTHGETRPEAVRQGAEAIAGWIESASAMGDPIPPPKVFDLGPDPLPAQDVDGPFVPAEPSHARSL